MQYNDKKGNSSPKSQEVSPLNDYKSQYFYLFNRITDLIALLEADADDPKTQYILNLLRLIQYQTEERFLSQDDEA